MLSLKKVGILKIANSFQSKLVTYILAVWSFHEMLECVSSHTDKNWKMHQEGGESASSVNKWAGSSRIPASLSTSM